jgi:CheY-like chemotaxis protein
MKRSHVIVVDDEAGIALLCERLLTANGFSVSIYTDPRIALQALTQRILRSAPGRYPHARNERIRHVISRCAIHSPRWPFWP